MIKHAFPPLVNARSRILILGTMPSEKSLEYQQYYGNKQNRFWTILFRVFQREFSEDYQRRKQLLVDFDLALWDVLECCERKGSLDSEIKAEKPNDIAALLKAYPQIKTIVFSSKNAEKFFSKYAERIPEIEYVTLPSPSGAYASMRLDEKIENWKIITQL
ncbi:DNA-deoxyinosine glycosylase [Flavobacterium sp. JP2137]|uniref:DNA-deoxyinosine glycosylase n=1 Tax=Flavobacterium sp. JP2137 TaxID=3414510 RepID=UPI003D2FEEE8